MKNQDYPFYKAKNFDTMLDIINYATKRYKHKIAFSYRGDKKSIINKTFLEFERDVRTLANAFLKNKITKKHIAIYAENSYEWLITYFASAISNNVVIPFDKELNDKEISDLIERSDASYLFYGSLTKDNTIKALKKKKSIKAIDLYGEEFKNLQIEGTEVLKLKKDLLTKVKVDPDKTSVILFTSGTTGVPKGVMLSQKNICRNMIDCSRIYTFQERLLLVLPLHHSFGITAGIMGSYYLGKTVIINHGLKDIPKDLVEFKPTDTVFVPLFVETLYNRIWLTAKQKKKDKLLKALIGISNGLLLAGIDVRRKLFKTVLEPFGGELKYIISGAAPLDPRFVKGFRNFGIEIRQGYGITESSPVVSVNRHYYYSDASVGQIIPNMNVKIVNPDENGYGEIHLKGIHIMKGYYKNLKETNKVLKNGWFNTEDIGYIDNKGFLYIKGRMKNLIILSNGKNIAAEELEMKIAAIDIIKEVVVTGKDDKIIAEVFLDQDLIKQDKITNPEKYTETKIDELNKTLPLYKNINSIIYRSEEFPKTTTKKIKR